ncbi:MAG: helix-turn-helix domain-containing protein [Bryobacteraceae bacterium]
MRNEAVIILSPHADVRASLTRLLEEAGYSTHGEHVPSTGILVTTSQPAPLPVAGEQTSEPPPTPQAAAVLPPLEEVERLYIEKVVRETGFNVSRAARILDIDRTTLYNKLRRYGLTRDSTVTVT